MREREGEGEGDKGKGEGREEKVREVRRGEVSKGKER